jgi:hypothetical protein
MPPVGHKVASKRVRKCISESVPIGYRFPGHSIRVVHTTRSVSDVPRHGDRQYNTCNLISNPRLDVNGPSCRKCEHSRAVRNLMCNGWYLVCLRSTLRMTRECST